MKCLQCGAEIEGKFCTQCGAPAPEEQPKQAGQVCSNCGEPVDGKFCVKCGTPVGTAPQVVEPVQATEPEQTTEPTQTVEPTQSTEPAQYQSQQTVEPTQTAESAQYQPQQTVEPMQDTPAPNETSFGQQFTNENPNAKKSMSGGKIAIIVVSIVLGIIIILGIIIGVTACNIFNSALHKYSGAISSAIDEYEWSSAIDDLESNISSALDGIGKSGSSSYDNRVTDPVSGCVFEESTEYDGWKVVDYNNMDYDTAKITVNIPSEFKGKPVVEIERFYVFDNDSSDKGYIKIVIPGSVKVIRESAFAFLEDVNEVVIEEGVETVEWGAFSGCKDLKIMHLPKSLKNIDKDCHIGFYCDDNYDYTSMKKDFTLHCPKDSEAEKYGKANGFKIVNE